MNTGRTTRVAALSACVAALLVAQPALAEIYKCVSADARVSFQDAPCMGAKGTTVNVRTEVTGVTLIPPKEPPPLQPPPPQLDANKPPPAPEQPLTRAQRDALQLKQMEADRRRRAIDYDIRDAESTLDALKASMEDDVSGLRTRRDTLVNTVPGSPLEIGASRDLQAASDRHQVQIRAAQDRVADLKKQRADLEKAEAKAP